MAVENPDRVTVATLRGEMREEFAELRGEIRLLTAELKAANDARSGLQTEVTSVAARVTALETWRTVQETTVKVAPPSLTWGRLFSDIRVWLVVAIPVAALIWAITHTK